MKYLLDTNAWIRYLNPGTNPLKQRLSQHTPLDIALCSVVQGELYYGAYHSSRRDANLALLAHLFELFVSLPFDDHAAREFGRIRAELAVQGRPIGPYDLQIAAIALAQGLILVTHNTAEFGRIAALRTEDWET